MRKLICSFAAALMVGFSAMADEGMWMLPLLQKLNADAMKDLGCRLTPDQIYSVNHSSLKDAIVIFGGGCTGEMISDKGLLVTNHHCGYSSIQQLSSDEHNYLEDGFWAMNSNEEIPVPGLSVTFLVNMSDVTEAIEGAESDEERKAIKEALVKAAEEQNPNCEAEVTSFYNNNVHYIIVYKIFRDIRFVGALRHPSESSAARPTTGCGRATRATSRCSGYMPGRTTSLLNIQRTMFLTLRNSL